jgi:spore coat polysaccharide biosynthesis protein SpsF
MQIVAIIQARMGSSRFPGKVLYEILDKPMLWHIINRVKFTPSVDNVIVATSDKEKDEPIKRFCIKYNVPYFQGSENDVLDRFYKSAVKYNGNPLIRITGDCPLIDPAIIEKVINKYKSNKYDHVGVAAGAGAIKYEKRYPSGVDAECINLNAIKKAWEEATKKTDREHVTPFIWRQPNIFSVGILKPKIDCSNFRLSVDHENDLILVKKIYENLYHKNNCFSLDDVIEFISNRPKFKKINEKFLGKEGYNKVW